MATDMSDVVDRDQVNARQRAISESARARIIECEDRRVRISELMARLEEMRRRLYDGGPVRHMPSR